MSDSAAGTQRAVWVAMLVALLMVGQLVASRALRDGFFLTHFEPEALATMMLGASVFSVVVLLASSRMLRKVAPARAIPLVLALSSMLFVLEWSLAMRIPRVTAVMLYLHVMSLGAVAASGFWSVVNERFDPYEAKRYMGRIGGGATLGGVLGGAAAWWGASTLEISTMILIVGVLNATCALGVLQIGRGHHTSAGEDEAPGSAVEIFRSSRYLRHLALLVALCAFCQATYDYVFKTRAASHFGAGPELVSFFALFYLSVNVATFLVQNLLARPSLERFGLAFSVSTLPGAGVILGLLGLLAPGLPTVIAMRAGIGVAENSLFRSGYELLYTPILPEKKRPAKPLIDVGGDKVGTALGASFAFLVLAVVPEISGGVLVLGGICASLGAIAVTRQLHRGYVASLSERLRAGSIQVEDVVLMDATTQLTIEQTRAAVSAADSGRETRPLDLPGDGEGVGRTVFLERVQTQEAARAAAAPRAASAPKRGPFRAQPAPRLEVAELDAVTLAIARLRSGDRTQIRDVLQSLSPLPANLVGHVIPLLEDESTSPAAFDALRRIAPLSTGALLDALEKSRTPLMIRRRLCDILAALPTQRCANGLVELLGESDFELRFRAAQGLLQVCRGNPQLRIPTDRIFDAAEREALECRRRWATRVALDPRISATPAIESGEGRRVIHGISYVWTLLLTVLAPEPLELAIRGLGDGNPAHRGTALEYLENVVPKQLLLALRPLLEDDELPARSIREQASILSEIMRDRSDGVIDLSMLRAHLRARRARP